MATTKPAPAPKPEPVKDAPAFSYETVEVPASPRGTTNPHLGKVRELNDARLAGQKSAAAFLVPAGADHDKRVGREVRRLQEAGASLGITVRKVTKTDDRGTLVTFWTTPKIERKTSGASQSAPVAG